MLMLPLLAYSRPATLPLLSIHFINHSDIQTSQTPISSYFPTHTTRGSYSHYSHSAAMATTTPANPTPVADPAAPNLRTPLLGNHYVEINPKDPAQLDAVLHHKFKPWSPDTAKTKHIELKQNDVGYITQVLDDGEHV